MEAYVGVDWSAKAVTVAVVMEGAKSPRGIQGCGPSAEQVSDLFQRIRTRQSAQHLKVFIEAGNELWVRLFHEAGATVFVLDSKQVSHFAKSCSSSGAKDDRRDSKVLAEYGRAWHRRLEPYTPPSELQEQLRTLAVALEKTSQQLTKTKQRLRAAILVTMPTVSAALSKFETRWIQRFLQVAPTPWHATRLKKAAFAKACAGASEPSKAKLWSAIRGLKAEWMTEGVAKSKGLLLQQLLQRLKLLEAQQKELESAIDDLSIDLPERVQLEAVGGIGRVLSIGLLVYAFDDGPSHRDQAAIRLGAAPVFRGSATDARGRPKGSAKMRKSAPAPARKYAYMLGRLATQNLTWAKAMYNYCRKRGEAPAKIYRKVSRSLLRILSSMRRHNTAYDEAAYIDRLKRAGAPWAATL